MTVFSSAHFERFCLKLLIDSKEQGLVPLRWNGSQRYLVEEISRALSEGVHTFNVLKGRQQGISTILLALDLYWMFTFSGLQGALITDTDSNKILFKSYITQYLKSLPPNARVPPVEHNREQLILKNRSRLAYIVAGKRKNESLGAGKAVNFMHATECAAWGDEEGLKSLLATLAQSNPQRLYVFESTAFGYNIWNAMWEAAKESTTTRAIFVGWWRNEGYQKAKNSIEYRTFWDGALTHDEKEWASEVWEVYGHNITDTQIAWWRWYLSDQCQGDINAMYQIFPPTENYAFQMSGSKFFSGERVNLMYKATLDRPSTYHRYKFGLHFEDTEFLDTHEQTAEVEIWEHPDPDGVYVIGADPAYGSSEWADEFVICVCRAFSDRIVQVAECATTDWTEAQYAWALAHLAGYYRGALVNLELAGPGRTVLNELNNMKRHVGASGLSNDTRSIYNVVAGIRDYLWRRQDSMGGGMSLQFETSAKEKIRLLSTLRNYFEREMLDVASSECAKQFRNISRNGDQIGGEGRAKDDRVIALALCVLGWNDHTKGELEVQLNFSYAQQMRPKEKQRQMNALEANIAKFFRSRGLPSP